MVLDYIDGVVVEQGVVIEFCGIVEIDVVNVVCGCVQEDIGKILEFVQGCQWCCEIVYVVIVQVFQIDLVVEMFIMYVQLQMKGVEIIVWFGCIVVISLVGEFDVIVKLFVFQCMYMVLLDGQCLVGYVWNILVFELEVGKV